MVIPYATAETMRAEALFASNLQPSEPFSPRTIRHAVGMTLRRLSIHGCTDHLAGEFGDHPEAAAARMTWALATVHAAYPATPAPGAPELTLTSV